MTEQQFEEQMRLLELDDEGVQALRALCRKNHKGAAGGSCLCACGASCGGTVECRGLRILVDWWATEYPARIQRLQNYYRVQKHNLHPIKECYNNSCEEDRSCGEDRSCE